MAAATSPFMSPLSPPKPMMSDDVNDEDRPQHPELRPLLFSNSMCMGSINSHLVVSDLFS